jgi:hypothetical protein
MELIGKLQLSPRGCAPHQIEMHAVGRSVGIVRTGEAHGSMDSTSEAIAGILEAGRFTVVVLGSKAAIRGQPWRPEPFLREPR